MHRIYANSWITIAATKATSATDGFLQWRSATALPFVVDAASQTVGQYFVSIRDGHWLEADREKYVEESVWNQRGWTLQERLVSKRVLHFTERMLYYECRQFDWMEDDRPAFAAVTRTPWLGTRPAGYHASPRDTLYDSWYTLTGRYSTRCLTKAEDKLPALSGVAHEMARLSGDAYLAGLWKGDLSSGLLWNTIGQDTRPVSFYRSPSWSWAQFDGLIDTSGSGDTQSEEERRCFTLMQAIVVPQTEDEMGRVQTGELTLRTKIAAVTSIRQNSDSSDSDRFPHQVYLGDALVALGRLDVWTGSVERAGLSALLVAKTEGKRDWKLATLKGLLLETAGDATRCFRRIGTFNIYGESSSSTTEGYSDLFDRFPEQEVRLI